MSLADHRRKVNAVLDSRKQFKRILRIEKDSLVAVQSEREATSAAQEIIQDVAAQVQDQAHKKIAAVVSRCLQAVFEQPYQFKIAFERKRGRTEARLLFERDANEIDPLTEAGGGVVDVAAFALRLACLLLIKPPARRLLILDEPFRFVSEEYRSRVAQLIQELSVELKMQIVMVTHAKEFTLGKVIQL